MNGSMKGWNGVPEEWMTRECEEEGRGMRECRGSSDEKRVRNTARFQVSVFRFQPRNIASHSTDYRLRAPRHPTLGTRQPETRKLIPDLSRLERSEAVERRRGSAG